MTIARRLTKATEALSPKQITLLALRKAHATGSVAAFAKRQLMAPDGPDVAKQIEAAFLASEHGRGLGRGSAEQTRAIREAQREGIFLWLLASQCDHFVLSAREAFDLRWLLWNQSLLLLACTGEGKAAGAVDQLSESSPFGFEYVLNQLWQLLGDLNAHAGAVRLIEERYFGGHAALFPDTREWLADRQARTEEFMGELEARLHGAMHARIEELTADRAEERAGFEGLIERFAARAAEARSGTASAVGLARNWIRLVKVQVHYKFGERGEADGLLRAEMEAMKI